MWHSSAGLVFAVRPHSVHINGSMFVDTFCCSSLVILQLFMDLCILCMGLFESGSSMLH